jgi:hypothetical protein
LCCTQTDYKLRGLDSSAMPSHLALTVRGILYPQREGRKSLRGHVEMSVGFNLPPALALVPEGIIRGVGETVRVRSRLLLQKNQWVLLLLPLWTDRRLICDHGAGVEAAGRADEAGLRYRAGSRFQKVQQRETN